MGSCLLFCGLLFLRYKDLCSLEVHVYKKYALTLIVWKICHCGHFSQSETAWLSWWIISEMANPRDWHIFLAKVEALCWSCKGSCPSSYTCSLGLPVEREITGWNLSVFKFIRTTPYSQAIPACYTKYTFSYAPQRQRPITLFQIQFVRMFFQANISHPIQKWSLRKTEVKWKEHQPLI